MNNSVRHKILFLKINILKLPHINLLILFVLKFRKLSQEHTKPQKYKTCVQNSIYKSTNWCLNSLFVVKTKTNQFII